MTYFDCHRPPSIEEVPVWIALLFVPGWVAWLRFGG